MLGVEKGKGKRGNEDLPHPLGVIRDELTRRDEVHVRCACGHRHGDVAIEIDAATTGVRVGVRVIYGVRMAAGRRLGLDDCDGHGVCAVMRGG